MAIPFDYTSEYKRKLRTPEEAARVVKSGDWLDISMGGAFPMRPLPSGRTSCGV